MIDLISFIIFIVLLGLSIVLNIYLYIKKTNLFKDLAEETFSKLILMDKLNKELASKDSQNVEKSDGFLAFVSQSRDWAFSYIEDAQSKIIDFDNKLTSIINGNGNKKETVKEILEAYKPIKELLPEDKEK